MIGTVIVNVPIKHVVQIGYGPGFIGGKILIIMVFLN